MQVQGWVFESSENIVNESLQAGNQLAKLLYIWNSVELMGIWIPLLCPITHSHLLNYKCKHFRHN